MLKFFFIFLCTFLHLWDAGELRASWSMSPVSSESESDITDDYDHNDDDAATTTRFSANNNNNNTAAYTATRVFYAKRQLQQAMATNTSTINGCRDDDCLPTLTLRDDDNQPSLTADTEPDIGPETRTLRDELRDDDNQPTLTADTQPDTGLETETLRDELRDDDSEPRLTADREPETRTLTGNQRHGHSEVTSASPHLEQTLSQTLA